MMLNLQNFDRKWGQLVPDYILLGYNYRLKYSVKSFFVPLVCFLALAYLDYDKDKIQKQSNV